MRLLALLPTIALVGCGQPQALHSDRNSDGTAYLAPWCQDRAQLRALQVPVTKVTRDNPILHPRGQQADGVWFARMIFIREDLQGWIAEDVEDHERCHELTFLRTGSPVFHR